MPLLGLTRSQIVLRGATLGLALAVASGSLTAQSSGGKPPASSPRKAPAKPASQKPATTPQGGKVDSAATAAATAAPAPVMPMGAITGIVWDSLNARPLVDAAVFLEGTPRLAVTSEVGRFRLDSIPPGSYRVRVQHELLDSLGVAMVTNPLEITDSKEELIHLAIPSAESMVELSCPTSRRSLGPSAIIGRLLDADTDRPVDSARVSFAWSELSLQTLRRIPKVREVFSASDGMFRICGLPNQLEGTLQAMKGGVNTAEVRVVFEGEALKIQGLRIGSANVVAVAEGDSVRRRSEIATGPRFSAPTLQRGNAQLTGRVIGANGQPIVGARVDVVGTPGATLTGSRGEFALSGLPSGTQSLVVRQIGFAPVEQPVELSTRSPARVEVRMTKPAQILEPVVVTAAAAEGLDRVGFNQRKKSNAGGVFFDSEEIQRRAPNMLTDLFRGVPGLRVVPGGMGNEYVVESSRNVLGGCVMYYVDGAPWEALYPGDVDRLYPATEIAAIEVYQSASSVPAQFQQPGKSSCAAIVIWSKTRTANFSKKR